MKYNLLTKYGNNLDYLNVLKDYPRPQLKRDSYYNLNGVWQYTINNDGNINTTFSKEIIVPFCIESYLSNVRRELDSNEFLIYKKEFSLDENFIKEITFIHFEAVDQECYVYLNGQFIGENHGGYLPFDFDITKVIKKSNNTLIVKVKDELNVDYPYGKQSKKRGGMWYTPVSGIWGSVWIESVYRHYIKDIKIVPNIDDSLIKLQIDTDSDYVKINIMDEDTLIYSEKTDKKDLEIHLESPKLWSPENPFVYKLKIISQDDEIESYFAMRKFSVNDKFFLLNNKPYFINGILDQGYFSDGIYTPASYQMYKDDILKMKNLGFNTLRKHIKIEPKLFYYYCDIYGMLVIQDMINVGKYSFLKDTLLPTLGFKKRRFNHVSQSQKENFIKHSKQTIDYLHNFPSVVGYTVFNEGWGQFDSDKMYTICKQLDPSRIIDTTSGWFKGQESDVDSRHIYFKKIKIKKSNKPIFISEFGGYSCRVNQHSFNKKREYGYRKYKDINKFENAFISLYENEILNNIDDDLAGAIYTQVSDVEDEINGLLTYDRQVCKINETRVKNLMNIIVSKFNNRHMK